MALISQTDGVRGSPVALQVGDQLLHRVRRVGFHDHHAESPNPLRAVMKYFGLGPLNIALEQVEASVDAEASQDIFHSDTRYGRPGASVVGDVKAALVGRSVEKYWPAATDHRGLQEDCPILHFGNFDIVAAYFGVGWIWLDGKYPGVWKFIAPEAN